MGSAVRRDDHNNAVEPHTTADLREKMFIRNNANGSATKDTSKLAENQRRDTQAFGINKSEERRKYTNVRN